MSFVRRKNLSTCFNQVVSTFTFSPNSSFLPLHRVEVQGSAQDFSGSDPTSKKSFCHHCDEAGWSQITNLACLSLRLPPVDANSTPKHLPVSSSTSLLCDCAPRQSAKGWTKEGMPVPCSIHNLAWEQTCGNTLPKACPVWHTYLYRIGQIKLERILYALLDSLLYLYPILKNWECQVLLNVCTSCLSLEHLRLQYWAPTQNKSQRWLLSKCKNKESLMR